eukprot:5082279-Prymnesium_polylepis.1
MDLGDALNMDPELRADEIEQAAAAARVADGEPEAAPRRFDGYPRLRYCLNLLWRTPGVPFLHSLFVGFGRFFYSLGL